MTIGECWRDETGMQKHYYYDEGGKKIFLVDWTSYNRFVKQHETKWITKNDNK